MKKLFIIATAVVMIVGLMASPAGAKGKKANNSLRSVATPAEVVVSMQTFNDVEYAAIQHGFTDTPYVWCEPARLRGPEKCRTDNTEDFHTMYLGVGSPAGEKVAHKGQISVYYDTADGWQSIIAKYDEGVLVSVNGVAV